jgi:hypothetical protein
VLRPCAGIYRYGSITCETSHSGKLAATASHAEGSAAALFGPTLIARMREATGHYQGAMQIIAIVMLLSSVVPLLLRAPSLRREPGGAIRLREAA